MLLYGAQASTNVVVALPPTGALPGPITVHNLSVAANGGVALWGQEFEQGAVPAGSELQAAGWSVQTRPRATYSDGSVKFAAMAAQPDTSIAGFDSRPLQLAIGTGATGADIVNTALPVGTLSQIDHGAGLLSAITRTDLAAASSGRTWVRQEYAGPLCSCWIYLTPANNGADDDLLDHQHIIWGGPSGLLRQRATAENTRLNPVTDGNRTASMIIDFLGAEVLNETTRPINALRRGTYFEDYTNFHVEKDRDYTARVVGLGPAIAAAANSAALDTRIASDLAAVNADQWTFDLQITNPDTGPGGRQDLNIWPGWSFRHLAAPEDADALRVMERCDGSGAGMMQIHYRDESTGRVPLLGTYLSGTNNWSSGYEGRAGVSGGSTIDLAHHAGHGLWPYLQTGDPYYREEAMMWGFWAASYNANTFIDASNYGTVHVDQIRGTAHGLRSLLQAWWVATDDEAAFRAEMATALQTTRNRLLADNDVGGANELPVPYVHHEGDLTAGGTGNDGYTSNWQTIWVTYWCLQGARLGAPGFAELRDYFGPYVPTLLTHPDFISQMVSAGWYWVGANYASGNETTAPTPTPANITAHLQSINDYRLAGLQNILNFVFDTGDTGIGVANRTNAQNADNGNWYTAMNGVTSNRQLVGYDGADSYRAYARQVAALCKDMAIPSAYQADIAYRKLLAMSNLPDGTAGEAHAAVVSASAEPQTALAVAMRAAPNRQGTVFNPSAGMSAANFQSPDTGGDIMLFTGTTAWDPVRRRIYLLAKDNGQGSDWVFGYYDADTDTWVVESTGEAASYPGTDPTGFGHSYDGMAVDPYTGNFYYCGALQANVGEWNGSTWGTITGSGLGTGSGTPAAGFMAERRELCVMNSATGTLRIYNVVTQTWSSGGAIAGLGGAHNVGAVNPLKHHFIFGGGDNSGFPSVADLTMYLYSNRGTLRQLADLPAGNGFSVQNGSLFGVDALTGEDMIFRWEDNDVGVPFSNILRLNDDETWSTEAYTGTTPGYGSTCCFIPEYEGNVFIDYNGGTPRMILYPTR